MGNWKLLQCSEQVRWEWLGAYNLQVTTGRGWGRQWKEDNFCLPVFPQSSFFGLSSHSTTSLTLAGKSGRFTQNSSVSLLHPCGGWCSPLLVSMAASILMARLGALSGLDPVVIITHRLTVWSPVFVPGVITPFLAYS